MRGGRRDGATIITWGGGASSSTLAPPSKLTAGSLSLTSSCPG